MGEKQSQFSLGRLVDQLVFGLGTLTVAGFYDQILNEGHHGLSWISIFKFGFVDMDKYLKWCVPWILQKPKDFHP